MRKHIFISGRVQGVGFRHFTRKNAQSLGVNGWVKNLPDGRVEAVFDGSEKNVREMINRCRKGPVSSRVENIEEEEADEDQTYTGFKVAY